MENTKLYCNCGCGKVLYITDFGDEQIVIGVEDNARKSFKSFNGVLINKRNLLNVFRIILTTS